MNPFPRRALAALAASCWALVACGGSSTDSADAAATAEGASTVSPSPASGDDAFPVQLTHAFGMTTIDSAPERVVTWGWGSTEASIALGVVPVAMPFQSYGADAEGVLPWVRSELESSGTPLPLVLPQTADPEIPFEAIAAADPDVIVAVYSGITDTDYELLSKIAPTVAYPDQPWTTPWRDVISITATALGRSQDAARVLADIDATIAEAAAAHPMLDGASVAMVWDTAGTFYVYRPADARVAFVEQLGMTSDPSVEVLANGESSFYYTLSPERVSDLHSDVLVAFADTEAAADEFLASAHARTMDQVERGAVARIVGPELIAAVSPPTALSLGWGIDAYVEQLAAAVAS